MLIFIICILIFGNDTHPVRDIILILVIFVIIAILNIYQTFPCWLVNSLKKICENENENELENINKGRSSINNNELNNSI